MAGSNRGFWIVILSLAAGGLVLLVLVFAFRPVARSGAIAYTQSNLRSAAAAAERVRDAEGSFASASAERLSGDPAVDDLLLIDPDQSSNDPEIVSVLASGADWTGSARAETGGCYWIRVEANETVLGTGTDCSAEEASIAAGSGWPEP